MNDHKLVGDVSHVATTEMSFSHRAVRHRTYYAQKQVVYKK